MTIKPEYGIRGIEPQILFEVDSGAFPQRIRVESRVGIATRNKRAETDTEPVIKVRLRKVPGRGQQ